MKLLCLAAGLTVLCLATLPATAETADNTIHGRSEMSLEADLRDRGVVTAGLEEWGPLIGAWVPNSEGGVSMQLFNPDTLEPVAPNLG